MNETYRLNISALAILSNGGKPSAVTIPIGAILERLSEDNGLTTCAWEGREVQLFSVDLQERGVLVRGAGPVGFCVGRGAERVDSAT
jgi:hypothetical protein